MGPMQSQIMIETESEKRFSQCMQSTTYMVVGPDALDSHHDCQTYFQLVVYPIDYLGPPINLAHRRSTSPNLAVRSIQKCYSVAGRPGEGAAPPATLNCLGTSLSSGLSYALYLVDQVQGQLTDYTVVL